MFPWQRYIGRSKIIEIYIFLCEITFRPGKMLESKHREKSNRIEVHTPEILEEIIADNEIHSSIYRKVRSFELSFQCFIHKAPKNQI